MTCAIICDCNSTCFRITFVYSFGFTMVDMVLSFDFLCNMFSNIILWLYALLDYFQEVFFQSNCFQYILVPLYVIASTTI